MVVVAANAPSELVSIIRNATAKRQQYLCLILWSFLLHHNASTNVRSGASGVCVTMVSNYKHCIGMKFTVSTVKRTFCSAKYHFRLHCSIECVSLTSTLYLVCISSNLRQRKLKSQLNFKRVIV